MLRYLTKGKLEPFDLLLNIIWKLTLSIGTLALIAYCLLEGAIPDGATAGDALFLVFVALTFGLILTVGTFFGGLSTLWLIGAFLAIGNFILKRLGRRTASLHSAVDSWFVCGVVSGLLFVVFVAFYYLAWVGGNTKAAYFIAFFPVAGFLPTCYFATIPPNGKRMEWKMVIPLFVAAFYIASNFGRAPLLDVTMGMLGVRTLPRDALVVSKDDMDRMQAWSTLYGISLETCPIDGANRWLLQNAVGVWHGIGATSYVRIGDTSDLSPSLLVPVPANDLTVLRQRQAAYRCTAQKTP